MTMKKIDANMQNEVALLAGKGASVTKISRETGLHHTSVKKILQEPAVIDLKEKIQTRLADKFEQLAESVLHAVSEDDLLKASLQQKAISAGCFLDKARLIRGESSANFQIAAFFQAVQDSVIVRED